MKRYTITIFIILQLISAADVKSQFNNNHWVFGDSAYIDWSNPLSPVVGSAAFNYRNGSSTIGDSSGILLYAGLINNKSPLDCYIWNKYHQRIGDSTKIYGGLWYHSSMFIPHPGNDSIIYLFTIGVTQASVYGFYSSTINYKANNDSGVVLQKNFQWNTLPAFDALMGVRHGNGRDWWVVSQRYTTSFTPSNAFYFYQVTPLGISTPFSQSIGSLRKTGGGHLIFNSSGTQFAQVSWMGMIELYNFDRCTGTITSTIPIEQEPLTSPYPHTFTSCAYSKDNSKLYVIDLSQSTSTYYLLQYDLLAVNISASKYVVDSLVAPTAPWQLKLAPDDKIYISSFDENYSWPYPDTSTAFTLVNNNLSVINHPDSLGAACDFQPFSFNLGTGRSYYGLPNNPDYELGAWVGSPCDTLSVGVEDNVPEQQAFFQAWYNSEWNMIHVNASKLKGRTGSLRLFDMEGRLVFEKKWR
ncbi:MAG: hypothetical protein IPN36_05440 [Bacteroidetes bacterium]|nr:hypothetical protein [Bacteroidota bacterium]